jgi:hypothetical protein
LDCLKTIQSIGQILSAEDRSTLLQKDASARIGNMTDFLHSPFLNTAIHAYDCFLTILSFLTARDVLSLSSSSSILHHLLSEIGDITWKQLCARVNIAATKMLKEFSETDVFSFFRFHNYKEMYRCFHRLSVPFFGLFRRIPDYPASYRGGLYCIYPDNDSHEIYCEYYPYGTEHNGNESPDLYRICYNQEKFKLFATRIKFKRSSQTNKLLVSLSETENDFELTLLQDCIYFHPESQSLSVDGETPRILKLAALPIASPFSTWPLCEGLYTAPYSAHGLEIIHLSFTPNETLAIIPNCPLGVIPREGTMRLLWQGLKISGDVNVPAGEISFVLHIPSLPTQPTDAITTASTGGVDLDLDSLVHLNTIFGESKMFIRDPGDEVDMEGRLQQKQIAACYPGYGQINADTSRWAPSWERCYGIIYHPENAPEWNMTFPTEILHPPMRHHTSEPILPPCMHNTNPKVAFSLLWVDEQSVFIYMMDFVVLPLPTPFHCTEYTLS